MSEAAASDCAESLFGRTLEEMQARLVDDGVSPAHARTLWRALYRELSLSPISLPGLPPPLQRWLGRDAAGDLLRPVLELRHASDSSDAHTQKFLFGVRDSGAEIETVVMAYRGRHTVCLSTQAGCAMGCVFCATGQMGFVRHLTAAEIVFQVVEVQRRLRDSGRVGVRNLVLMGMGEPLHNYDPVMRALEIVSERGGLNIGPSRITISTVGLVPGILRLAQERRPYHLAVSLHGVTDEERSALVPINQRWPLAELLQACREYTRATERHILFGWTLIEGRNDTPSHAQKLAALLKEIPAHVNLIRLNPTRGFDGKTSAEVSAEAFQKVIQAAGIPCTIRQHRGIDVDAGCGQLSVSRVGKPE